MWQIERVFDAAVANKVVVASAILAMEDDVNVQ